MEGIISASMMCADLVHLKETIKVFEEEQVEYLHIDVMDGEFVPNFGLGVDSRESGGVVEDLGIHHEIISGILLKKVIDSIHLAVAHGDTDDGGGDETGLDVEQTFPVDTKDADDGSLTGLDVGEGVVVGVELDVREGLLHGLNGRGAAGGAKSKDRQKEDK